MQTARPWGNSLWLPMCRQTSFTTPRHSTAERNQYLITYNDFRDDVSSVYAVIIDDSGAVVKEEFLLCTATGHQVNPVVCYNPTDDTWLINWEDFRAHGNSLEALGTLEVMTDIYGALLSADGTILAGDIPMCADANTINADQRFNGIAYNPKKNEFLASWTDTRDKSQTWPSWAES